eukprot:scaffold178_cov255-Pinguiococcus_pyrenoidosus.AAC.18
MICSTSGTPPAIASSMGEGSMFSPFDRTIVSFALPVITMSPVAGLIRPRSPVSKKPFASIASAVAFGFLW